MTTKYQLLSTETYFSDVLNELQKAKKRVIFQTMYFIPGGQVSTILERLVELQHQHIQVEVIIDSFSQFLNPQHQEKHSSPILQMLQEGGVQVFYTNPFLSKKNRLFPYFGRNHIKITIIDDYAYLGGINLAGKEQLFIDCMIKINDLTIVETLYQVVQKSKTQTLQSQSFQFDARNQLLVDVADSPSLIYQKAQTNIRLANKKVIFTSQFVPDGNILSSLHLATRRGVQVTVLAPKKNTFSPLFALIHRCNFILMVVRRKRVPIVWSNRMIHAKILLLDDETVMIGSHNLSILGVIAHTSEIMLESRDLKLVTEVKRFIADQTDK